MNAFVILTLLLQSQASFDTIFIKYRFIPDLKKDNYQMLTLFFSLIILPLDYIFFMQTLKQMY